MIMVGSDAHILRKCWFGLLVASLLSLPTSALSTILPDAVSSATGNTASLAWSHTIGSGSDRILIVGVSNRRTNRTVNSVTYGGISLTRIGTRNSGANSSRMQMWYLLAPPQGTAQVIVTLSGGTTVVGGAISFFGIHQTTPMGAFASAAGTGFAASLSVGSAVNDIVVDVAVARGTALSLTPGVGQTSHWNTGTGTGTNDVRGAGSRKNGASSVTVSWALGAFTDWAVGAVSLKPALYPNMVLTLVQNNGTPPPGTTVVYTINYQNTGDGQAGNSLVSLPAPPNTSFVADGVVLNGVPKTDVPDADEVTRSGSTITVNLGAVAAGAGGTLSYTVVIQ